MFTLKLFDRKGNELKEGDIVKISDGKRFTFFSEVKYLEKEKMIAPFHTFSFISFEKVDTVPEIAKKSTEDRYGIWYISHEDAEDDSETFDGYLMTWRQIEDHFQTKCWQIEKT